jgi:hypothetical protein
LNGKEHKDVDTVGYTGTSSEAVGRIGKQVWRESPILTILPRKYMK